MEDERRRAYAGATVGALAGGVAGAAVALLIALPLKPSGGEGWEELGWSIFTVVGCAVAGIAAAAVGVHRALRRIGAPAAGPTALAFVPVAVLLVLGGPLVLAAPVVARWLVLGFRERPAGAGWTAGGGRAQRVVLWAILSGLGILGLAGRFGHELGGQVGGTAKVWAVACLPPLVFAPLLWRALPAPSIAALVVAAAAVAGPVAQQSTREVHPEPARLAEIGRDLHVPAGQRVVRRVGAFADSLPPARRPAGSRSQPVEVLLAAVGASTGPNLPASLTAGPDGFLPHRAPTERAAAREAMRAAAAAWERSFLADGWAPLDARTTSTVDGTRMPWLPNPAADYVAANGTGRYARGLWQRAVVVPTPEGVIVVLTTRP